MIDVIGIGATGLDLVSAELRGRITDAEVVVGSLRVLALLPESPTQTRRAWPSPLVPGLPGLLAEFADRRLVVLATGDPLLSGIGTTLIDLVGPDQVSIHPGLSSVVLARARMGWSAESSTWVSLVSAPAAAIRRFLSPRARILVLSSGPQTPRAIADELEATGWSAARMAVLANLGATDESRHDGTAGAWGSPQVSALNIVAIELPDTHDECDAWGTSPGLPDRLFENDGQLSKREIRAAALSALRPMPGQLLIDIGAGAGSIGIEWALHHPTCRTIAIERDKTRATRITRNAMELGATNLAVREADIAIDTRAQFAEMPVPDAVFIGGALSRDVIDASFHALALGGRLVTHAVTLDSENLLFEAYRAYGGFMRRIAVERAEPLGTYLAWKPMRAVVEWSATRQIAP